LIPESPDVSEAGARLNVNGEYLDSQVTTFLMYALG
jgi:hypothetical protein